MAEKLHIVRVEDEVKKLITKEVFTQNVEKRRKIKMPLPEGRKALTDQDMIILLHVMARSLEQRDPTYGSEVRQTADRFSELVKAAGIAQHKAQQG